MSSIFINVLLLGLLLLCVLMTVIILMQRPSANAGMGAALGGGAAESVFGGETSNVLLKNTIWIAVGFFVFSFVLFLWIVAGVNHTPKSNISLPKAAALSTTANTTSANTTTGTPTTPAAASDLNIPETHPVEPVPPAPPKP